jgi:hypothetical protein
MDVHQRVIPASLADLGTALETLATPDDQIWVTRIVPPIHLDQGLAVGSKGGHGPIRYKVCEHEPGVRVRFQFAPGSPLIGWHQIDVADARQANPPLNVPAEYADRPHGLIRHTLSAELSRSGRVLWPLLIRPLHDAAVEDMFNNLEIASGGTAHPQQLITAWVHRLGAWLTARSQTLHADSRSWPQVHGSRSGLQRGDTVHVG